MQHNLNSTSWATTVVVFNLVFVVCNTGRAENNVRERFVLYDCGSLLSMLFVLSL